MAYTPERWREFIGLIGEAPPTLGRPYILESWMRCREQGLEPAPEPTLLRRIETRELQHRLEKNHKLLSVAAPILSGFSASLGDLQHVLYITDRDGIVLWSDGNDALMLIQGLVPGFDWSERTMGTNGAGTALATNRPVAVVGPEHYQLPFHPSTCLGAPIHDGQGELIGAVDFSTQVGDADPSQLLQVINLAHQIERRLAGRVAHLSSV